MKTISRNTKARIKNAVDYGITEEYVNTVIRINPSKWDVALETKALCDLLIALQEKGFIEIK